MLLDSATGAITVVTLLVRNRGVGVCAEPNFGGAVLGRHADQGYVDDQGEGQAQMIKVCVGVGGLGGRRCGCCCRQGRVSRDEAQRGFGA